MIERDAIHCEALRPSRQVVALEIAGPGVLIGFNAIGRVHGDGGAWQVDRSVAVAS